MQPNNNTTQWGNRVKDGAVILSLSAIVFAACALFYEYRVARDGQVADNVPASALKIDAQNTVVKKQIVAKSALPSVQSAAQRDAIAGAVSALKQETGKQFKQQRQVDVKLKNRKSGEEVAATVSTLKSEDGETRTHLSTQSSDWEIDGLDTLVEQPAPPVQHKNAVGLWSNIDQSERGLFYERDVGRVRLGVDVGINKENKAKVVLRAGVTF